jgi:hypothetical protein
MRAWLLVLLLSSSIARAEPSPNDAAVGRKMKIAGAVITAVGSAAALVSLGSFIFFASSDGFTSSDPILRSDSFTMLCSTPLAVPLLAIGLPLTIVGANREARATTLRVSASSLSVEF